MGFKVLPQLKRKILQQYAGQMERCPQKRAEVELFLEGREEGFGLCLRFLYGHMTVTDLVSFSVEQIAGYVEASMEAYEKLDYVRTIPQEIFFPYVLTHRVNSECLDCSRGELMAELLPIVQGKPMEQAALAVNYWCYSRATYTPSDDRTLGPLAVLRRTLGRCGEESVLTVAALRSVGLPARQCYCPRWSHCDDNHAWVEVWIDGGWHYLGACEPEPVLDKGWFTAAASRAMLVHTKCWSGFGEPERMAYTTPLYGLVNCTGRYADTCTLTVCVRDHGVPQQDVEVAFQIVNYSELVTLYQDKTDPSGQVRFNTGLGDLCVYIFHHGRMLLKKVDMRVQTGMLELDLADGYAPEELPERVELDLTPPDGTCAVEVEIPDLLHTEKLRKCRAHRAAAADSFCEDGESAAAAALRAAAGNWPEIRRFLEDSRYDPGRKEEILSTLRQKDFVDITCEVLFDAMDTAESVRGRYPEDVFREYILAPRVADEMLLPERAGIRSLFPEGFESPRKILDWMRVHIQVAEDHRVTDYYPSAYGCLYYRQCPAYSFDMVFVSLCRAFHFPARLAPDTGEGQWLDEHGVWRCIHECGQTERAELCLINPTGKVLTYFEHVTLGRWNGHGFDSLRYWGLSMEGRHSFAVRPGLYRLITTTRQIDGTASVILWHFRVEGELNVVLELPPDQTARRLKREPLLLPEGAVNQALRETAGSRRILIFADPGSEPTEHLLQELLQCADNFHSEDLQIRIFVDSEEGAQNETLRKTGVSLRSVQIQVGWDLVAENALHRIMQVGDLRRPFVVFADENDCGVYAAANYQIRMAQTLLLIQTLLSGGI